MQVIQRFPALWLAGCFSTGIYAGMMLDQNVFYLWLGLGIVCTTVATISLFTDRRRLFSLSPLVQTVCLAGAVGMLGAAMYTSQVRLPADHIAHHVAESYDGRSDQVINITGRITASPHVSDAQFRLVVSLDSLQTNGINQRVNGKAQVTLWLRNGDSAPRGFRKGDVVSVQGNLQPPPRPRNPADMDYGAYLERRGIFAVIEPDQQQDIQLVDHAPTWRDRLIEPIRKHVNTQIETNLPTEEAQNVLRALLLGDRSGIEADRREQFVGTGLMHLLAVSGLHVLLVGFVLYQLMQPFLLRFGLAWRITEITRATVTMVVLVIYMLLTETRPSVVRATVMAGLFIGGSVLQRSSESLNTLGVAACVLLIARPTQLFDVGFQLSFSAVAAILLLNPILQNWVTKGREDAWWEYFATIFTTTIAATAGTLPVLLAHFGFASFAGLVLNLLAIPATALGLAGGLLMVLTGIWWSALAEILGQASDVFLRGLLETASIGMSLFGWASVETSLDVWSGTILLSIMCLSAGWRMPRVRWAFVLLIAGSATISVWQHALEDRSLLDVIFLDVGQANAALVKLPDGGHALFDAGLYSPFVDSGERTIVPHLEHYGINHLDAVVISHPHSDHLGGLVSILQSVSVDTVYTNGQVMDTAVYQRTRDVMDSLEVEERVVRKGDMIPLGSTVHAKVLYPTEEALGRGNVNDASVVVRLSYGVTSFLFLGDAEREAEGDMKTFFPSFLSADVIQVGHHGSATSSKRGFLRKMMANAPEDSHAVISAGARNRYGHPDDLVLGRWEYKNAQIHWTALTGAVLFSSNGQDVKKVEWR